MPSLDQCINQVVGTIYPNTFSPHRASPVSNVSHRHAQLVEHSISHLANSSIMCSHTYLAELVKLKDFGSVTSQDGIYLFTSKFDSSFFY
jgi:hypothetical protein